MAKIRVTRFAHHTRYAVLVPNEQSFDFQVIKRVTRRPSKQPQAVQLPLPLRIPDQRQHKGEH